MNNEIAGYYCDKHLLITGGSGFLGTNLLEALKDTGANIRILSRHHSVCKPVPGLSCETVTGDITLQDVWERALEGIDIVFHFAAQTSLYVSAEDPVEDLKVNVLPMLNMLERCRKRDACPAILFAGTVTEAGIATRLPVDETHPDNPVTVYDLHKLMAENYLKYYVKQGIVKGAALRLSNIYGPGPESAGAGRGVVNSMVRKALRGEALTIYGDGNYLRDYIYVEDAAMAFLAAGAGMAGINGHHYVIGSGEGCRVSEMVNMVAKQVGEKTGRAVTVIYVDPPAGMSPIEERNFIADTRNFSQATGWRAGTSLKAGLDLTIDYFSGGMRSSL